MLRLRTVTKMVQIVIYFGTAEGMNLQILTDHISRLTCPVAAMPQEEAEQSGFDGRGCRAPV